MNRKHHRTGAFSFHCLNISAFKFINVIFCVILNANVLSAGQCNKDLRYKISSELLKSYRIMVYLENTMYLIIWKAVTLFEIAC